MAAQMGFDNDFYSEMEQYRYGYGPPPEAHYAQVEIFDVPIASLSTALSDREKFVFYEDLLRATKPIYHAPPSSSIGLSLEALNRRGNPWWYRFQHKMTNGGVMNPSSGGFIYCADSFKLLLSTRCNNEDAATWQYFASIGLEAYFDTCKETPSKADPSRRSLLQRFRVSLKHNARYGMIQFFQSARQGAFTSKGDFPYASIFNFFVYRDEGEQWSSPIYPPVVTVLPKRNQHYVPLKVGQVMQIIVSDHAEVTSLQSQNTANVRMIGKHKAAIPGFTCWYYRCEDKSPDSFPIYVKSLVTGHRSVIVVAPIEIHNRAEYAVLHYPMNDPVVHPNGLDGLIFRTAKDHFKGKIGYLDSTMYLNIEHHLSVKTPAPSKVLQTYELRARLMEKISKIEITNLFDSNACKVTSY